MDTKIGGAAIQGDARAERDLTGRDVQRMVDANFNFQNKDSERLWEAIMRLSTQLGDLQGRLQDKIALVDLKLDDIPNRVQRLEVKVNPVPLPVPVPISFPVWLALCMVAIMLVVTAFFAGRIL